jgi:hypothetical protein
MNSAVILIFGLLLIAGPFIAVEAGHRYGGHGKIELKLSTFDCIQIFNIPILLTEITEYSNE